MPDVPDNAIRFRLAARASLKNIESAQRAAEAIERQHADLLKLAEQHCGQLARLSAMAQLPSTLKAATQVSRVAAELQARQASWNRVFAAMPGSQATRVAAAILSGSRAWSRLAESNLRALELAAAMSPVPLKATAAAVTRPLRLYGDFSTSTLQRLSVLPPSSSAARALERSLEVAGFELGESSAVTELLVGMATEESTEDEPERIGTLNLLVVEREELVATAGSGGVLVLDDADLITLAGHIARRVRRLPMLIVGCNEAAGLTGRGKVFKYTDAGVSALYEMGWLIPRTKNQLRDFVGGLYFALYEGAGADSLRYLGEGLLTDDECEVIWHLKHMRNKWLGHDHEHGSPSEVRRSKAELREALDYFGADHLPRTYSDFRALHRSIVEKVLEFLELLLARLEGPCGRD